jgi:hypothetical protein
MGTSMPCIDVIGHCQVATRCKACQSPATPTSEVHAAPFNHELQHLVLVFQ